MKNEIGISISDKAFVVIKEKGGQEKTISSIKEEDNGQDSREVHSNSPRQEK